MPLQLRNFQSLLQQQAAAAQASAKAALNFTVGSVLRAIFEASSGIGLWVQSLIFQVLQAARLSTASGTDVDSFGTDFGFTRVIAAYAFGSVTFSRFVVPSIQSLIPVGALVSTTDGSEQFAVVADNTNPAYNAATSTYIVTPSTQSITIAVQAVTPGSAGNVQAGAISLMNTAIPGIDTVTNSVGFAGGSDPESDNAYRARFVNFINTRALGTDSAVDYAISNVQSGILYSVAENVNPSGGYQPGNFVVTIDDGSGNPPATLIQAVITAVSAVRPITVTFSVQKPTVVTANINILINVAPGYAKTAVAPQVVSTVTSAIDALGIGVPLYFGQLYGIIYDVPGVLQVTSLSLNGSSVDIGNTDGTHPQEVVRAGTITVS